MRAVRRRYRPGTLILETEFETADGVVVLSDCMPIGAAAPVLVRMVEGTRGAVPMRIELAIRLDFGSRIPWVRRQTTGSRAIGGPDALPAADARRRPGEDFRTVGDFTVAAGESRPFTLAWYPSQRA